MCNAGVACAGQYLTSQAVVGRHAARNTLRPTWCACPLCAALVHALLDHMFKLCTKALLAFLEASALPTSTLRCWTLPKQVNVTFSHALSISAAIAGRIIAHYRSAEDTVRRYCSQHKQAGMVRTLMALLVLLYAAGARTLGVLQPWWQVLLKLQCAASACTLKSAYGYA